MQLEELQQQWQRLDQKLDHLLVLETELVRQVVMQPARHRIHRLAIWPAIDIVFCVSVLFLCAAFLTGHWREWHFVIPAITVISSFVALLIDNIRQLQRVTLLDWCGPVAEIQRSLETLRVGKIRQFKWIILLSPLVGFCGLLVGLHWLFVWSSDGRFDILSKLDSRWIGGNLVFGVMFVPLGYLFARALSQRCHTHRWWQSVLDDISGTSLKAAAQDVERWASLQQDAPSHST